MARARIGSNVEKGLKFFCYGKHGTRKSNCVADFAKMNKDGKPLRVLYIDCETGSIDGFGLDRLESEGVDLRNIYIVYTSALSEIRYYCDKIVNDEPLYHLDEDGIETEEIVLDADGKQFIADAIIIDGITVVADNVSDAAINLSEKRAAIRAEIQGKTSDEKEVMVGTAGLEFKDFNKIKSNGKSLVRNLITNTDKYVAITGRAKDKKEMIKNAKGEMVLTYMGYEVPEAWDFIQYEVYTVIHNMVNADGEVYAVIEQKDRTGKYKQNEIVENPSVLLWQDVVDSNKNRGKNVGMSQGSVNDTVRKNEESYKEIAGYNDNSSKNTNPNSSSTTDSQNVSVESLINTLNKVKESMPPTKRKAMKPMLEKEGLPIKFTPDLSIETLQKIYDIMTKN
ncbi:MAG: hypothetical protein PHX04_05815 [Bacilli bacterium]|nr:hypothetical protein [Bacilli bacterium]